MNKLMRSFRWVCVALLLLLLFCACQTLDQSRAVPVLLADAEGLTCSSEKFRMVAAGDSVSFPAVLADDFVLESLSCGQYIDGQIVLENVYYPTTIVAYTRPVKYYLFDLTNARLNGTVTTSHTGGRYREGSEITVTARPQPGKVFIGFSLGNSIKNGGEVVARDSTYTFSLNAHTELFTNYATEGSDLIFYHAGGGKFADVAGDVLTVEIIDSYYLCPNVNIADDFLTRPGYTLLGYTTDEAGQGKLLTPGANIVMPEDHVVHLWPVWAEWTPADRFTIEDRGDTVSITGYTGNEDVLVIPAEINGKPVVRIDGGAISGSFHTLVLHSALERISPRAVCNCPNFKELFFYDTVKIISDHAFDQCPEFQTLHLCAAQPPRYSNHRHGTYAKKFERLITAEGKKLVVASGSSTVYGMDSLTMEQAMKGEYSVVNYGTHWRSPVLFYLDLISNFVGEGDIVIHAPETIESQLGGNSFEFNLWQMNEGAPEVFAYVDIRNYQNVFNSFADYNATRSKLAPLDYETYHDSVNNYGDYYTYKKAKGIDYVGSPGYVNFNISLIKPANTAQLNRVAAQVSARGGQMLLSFAPSNRNSLVGTSLKKETRTAYVNRLTELLDYPRITDVERMLLPGNWFYDSDWHLCTERAITRAEMLAEDLTAYLNSVAGGNQ